MKSFHSISLIECSSFFFFKSLSKVIPGPGVYENENSSAKKFGPDIEVVAKLGLSLELY